MAKTPAKSPNKLSKLGKKSGVTLTEKQLDKAAGGFESGHIKFSLKGG